MASIKRIGKDSLGVPIWEAVYRRTPGGKQIRRRFHMETKAEVQRAILLDGSRSDIGLKWSEGADIYLEAKRIEGKGEGSLENVRRAVRVFIEIMGDMEIEGTEPDRFKWFMQKAAARPVNHKYAGRTPRLSGSKVANHHRRELLAVANYLLRHAGKIVSVPFGNVPPLPAVAARREPIPREQVSAYIGALPPHVRRPVLMVLYYGLRSTAVCDLTPESVSGGFLSARDKGGVRRRIPVDAMLEGILKEAAAFRATFPVPGAGLFLTVRGASWNRMSLLHAAQRAWNGAGLEKKKIHEVRHTLGTIAGKNFTPGMVQAAMGHRSRKSAEVYFHPDEEMAAEVRQRIITELSQKSSKDIDSYTIESIVIDSEGHHFSCPCCGSNLIIPKEKGRKP